MEFPIISIPQISFNRLYSYHEWSYISSVVEKTKYSSNKPQKDCSQLILSMLISLALL